MDAWLPEFQCDGRGTSIVLIRQPWIADIIADGTRKGSIIAQRIGTNRVIASQRERLLYRRQMLRERLWLAERDGKSLRKRVPLVRPSFLRRWHIRLRENIRATSHTALRAASAPDSSAVYDTCMASLRRQETVFTAIERRVVRARSFVRRFLGLMRGGRK